ncbi:ABC transporter [Penicillium longicatenatum]|uniref:ABC transporter n=1 Tax=Penicillium longicatenatum TaxID=1561947 RepID=UPI002546ADDD|nr:ABC transporter [Penicillium longicatenatum]KAJ5657159.1 ABC transporter [Penicillium longicatenatum]
MLLRTALRSRAPHPLPFHIARSVSSVPLIQIKNGTFYRQYPTQDDAATNPPLYPNFNFTLPSQGSPSNGLKPSLQHWAVVGPSGRTDLLDVLRGQHICLPPTARSYPYLLTDEIAAKDPQLRYVGNAVQYIGFSGEGSGAIGGTRGAYLSARYESLREETDWTVEQFLRGQTSLNPLEGEEKGTIHDEQLIQEVITDLHLSELLNMPVANLSNGQTRRARIAKALLKKPELLLLDEPFMGLDPATVRSISGLLHRLAEKSSPRLILALRPQDTVPEWVTHLIVVGNSQQVMKQGSRSEIIQTLAIWKRLVSGNNSTSGLNDEEKAILRQARRDLKSGALDEQLVLDFASKEVAKPDWKEITPFLGGEPLIEMEGVRVKYGDKVVLGNWTQKVNEEVKDGLHWRVRRGQRWAILGANGSGKTTLLSLITSDHPQAYAQPIKFLGRSRLPEIGKPAISIFELQSRLGHSSPEIHAFFPRQLTVRAALESAFAETFLSKPALNYERDLDVNAALRHFKAELDPNASATKKELPPTITTNTDIFPKLSSTGNNKPYIPSDYDIEYADNITFGQLTTAQQRIVLFLRALIHNPDIVILDEPFSGLSASQRDKCLHYIDHGDTSSSPSRASVQGLRRYKGLSRDQALVMISHVKEEIPESVRHYMRLPSEPGDGTEPLDFRFGLLKNTSVLSDPKVWDAAWSPPSHFSEITQRTRRRHEVPSDIDVYEWFSI